MTNDNILLLELYTVLRKLIHSNTLKVKINIDQKLVH